ARRNGRRGLRLCRRRPGQGESLCWEAGREIQHPGSRSSGSTEGFNSRAWQVGGAGRATGVGGSQRLAKRACRVVETRSRKKKHQQNTLYNSYVVISIW